MRDQSPPRRPLRGMRVVWMVLLVGCTSHHVPAGDDAMPPGDDDAMPPGDDDAMPPGPPTVDSVKTADGFTQIRQGETVQLVVTGSELAGVTGVQLGRFTVSITTHTATEIRGDIAIPHGFASGPLSLSASFPAQTLTVDNAITITPYVVSAAAGSGGHGTFQSPLALCDPNIETATRGDVL